MNQQTNQPTEQAPKASVTPPEITSLGSQETVAANISEIFADPTQAQPPTESISPVVPIKETIPEPEQIIETPPAPTVEVNADNQPIETFAQEAPAPSSAIETPADNLLTNPLEPVIEEESPQLRDPASTTALLKDVQRMLKEKQFPGAEDEVIHKRIEHTSKISLS